MNHLLHHGLSFGAVVGLGDSTILKQCFARPWCLCLALRRHLKKICVPLLDTGIEGKNVWLWKFSSIKVTMFLASAFFKKTT